VLTSNKARVIIDKIRHKTGYLFGSCNALNRRARGQLGSLSDEGNIVVKFERSLTIETAVLTCGPGFVRE
jgi:hypothetical protein